ncbi:hypothetical protein ACQP25_29335 [Microtetraspora malaysiensis]|uniref:hypothetical protein n=1 Tax=Microtetraspora malaysiensis TaxID=161358 RepID=UPI003D8ED5EA
MHDARGLAGDVAFKAADDLLLGLAFAGSAFDIGLSLQVDAHAHGDGEMERGFGGSIAAGSAGAVRGRREAGDRLGRRRDRDAEALDSRPTAPHVGLRPDASRGRTDDRELSWPTVFDRVGWAAAASGEDSAMEQRPGA